MSKLKMFRRMLLYGWIFNYHVKKQYKYGEGYETLMRYHYEKARYYYIKMSRTSPKE